MPDLLCFSRNRRTGVEQVDEHTLRSSCILQDTLTDARVEILVRLPDLEIIRAEGRFRRTHWRECRDTEAALEKIRGVRIGSGMLKIIEGLIGEVSTCRELAFMVEECCHGVILAFTRNTLRDCPEDEEGKREHFSQMVKENIRLYNRCAAFAPGSSIVRNIEPPST